MSESLIRPHPGSVRVTKMLDREPSRWPFPALGLGFKLFMVLTLLLFFYFFVKVTVYLTFFAGELEKSVINNAIQVSDLIKRSTRYSMLKNQREDLQQIIDNIGKEEGVEGIWIYNKEGEIEFSNHREDLYKTVGKEAEQCVFCHQTDEAKGTIPEENRYRFLRAAEGYRIVGLINPIENDPSCVNSGCHAHSAEDHVLGLMDIRMSLREVDESVSATRWKIIVFSCILVVLAAALFWGLIHYLVRRPIRKLIEGTRQIAQMNLNFQIDLRSRDEIGALAASFNLMTSELKKAQNHLVFVEKMASLGKLSAMVAHQLNNPIAGILNYAKLSIRNLKGEAKPEMVCDTLENLEIIREEVKRCGDIVNNMLLFSKKTVGKMGQYDFNATVRRSAELVRHSFEVKNVRLHVTLEEPELSLLCDRDALQQMMVALLINSLESSPPERGEVTIRTVLLRTGETIRLTISDNGPGIPEDVLENLFEPFYSARDSEMSTGLGLSIAYSVVQGHGGTITVQSSKDGTTFTIDLPHRREPRAAPEVPGASTAG